MTTRVIVVATAIGALLGWITASPTLGEKGADVRLWDVVVLGPWLLVIANKGQVDAPSRLLLAIAGGATVTHNLRNLIVRQRQLAARTP